MQTFQEVHVVELHTSHREFVRARSPHVVLALPHTDGDLARVVSDLEETLLALDDPASEEDEHLPDLLVGRATTDAVGRLASYVTDVERQPAAVQPIAPDGRFELIPLFFVTVAQRDLDRIVGAVGQLAAAAASPVPSLITHALHEGPGAWDRPTDRVAELRHLAALLLLPCDNDVELMRAVLDRRDSSVSRVGERVVLTAGQYAAYKRVTDRILATWHRGDSLARFLYRGAG